MALLQQLQLRQQTTVHASRQRSKVSWLHRSHASSVQQLPLRSCARSRQEEDSCNIKRRQLLYSAGILASALNPARAVAAQSTILTLETAQPSSENEAGFAPVPPTYITAPGRVVAIGDLHGDRVKALKALQLAGVIAPTDTEAKTWIGGNTVLVQLGDVLDRGDSEIELVMLLRELDRQARTEGGAVYMLNGNHESLNVCGDFRYVTAGALQESLRFMGVPLERVPTLDVQQACSVRFEAYQPGGPMAKVLAENPTVLVVNDTVFVHGGLTMQHVQYGLERLNREVCRWMRADQIVVQDERGQVQMVAHPPPYLAIGSAASVMWNRTYGKEIYNPIEKLQVCNELYKVLEQVGAKRLVVGHTPQLRGVNEVCNGCAWRIDVGMSGGVLGASPQVLEIVKNDKGDSVVSIMPNDSLVDMLGTLDEDSVDF